MHFVVIARDGTDSEAMVRRMEARENHIKLFKQGLGLQNILGGAILNEEEGISEWTIDLKPEVKTLTVSGDTISTTYVDEILNKVLNKVLPITSV